MKFSTLVKHSLILCSFGILFLPSIGKAQLSFSNQDTVVISDQYTAVTAYVTIINTSASPMSVYCDRVANDTAHLHESSFCWGPQCYPAVVSHSPTASVIPAGGSDNTFHGNLNPWSGIGISYVRYCFSDSANAADSVCMTFQYRMGVLGLPSINPSTYSLSTAYPNPSGSLSMINYRLPEGQKGEFVVYSSVGSEVLRVNLESATGKVLLNTTGLSNGLYSYSLLLNNNKLDTRRLVVMH